MIQKILTKIMPSLYKEISLNERIKIWCGSIGKDFSYGRNMTHEKLDKLGVVKFKIKNKNNK